ncbi:hypothetical protein FAES_4571 [Fibrella aestuarina BUZ 2]|uniref:DUF4199 domain-containing protein n=1 Tax=Fibrella aestuarina BUZ 2 TaxID=1166018 RepID=I0KEL7_9BACT|nr:DUF4199 domain-containing protein [Fibrella aestuarina]CCH02570.1 hypothetical protein FAES_4571 [Fibrella aestuarina BUZ 2]
MNYFNHPLLRVPLLFGLGAGLAAFLLFLGLHTLGITALYVYEKYPFDFGIHLIVMIAAVWYYRRNVGKGLLHMWEGLTICYVVNTVAALVAGWLIYAFVTWVDPSEFTRYINELTQFQLHDKANYVKTFGEEAYKAQLAQTAATTPDVLPLSMLGKKTLLGILPILIISLVFRKQDYSALD